VNFFKGLFTSAASRFDNLDIATKVRVSTVVGLAGFALKSTDESLFSNISSQLKVLPSKKVRARIITELALATITSSSVERSSDYLRVWALEEGLLKELTCLLILSESRDTRASVAEVGYSTDPAETILQVIQVISKILGENELIHMEKLNTPEFRQEWFRFTSKFIGGTLAGMASSDLETKLTAISDKISRLSARSKSIVFDISKILAKQKKDSARKYEEAKQRKKNRRRRQLNDREEAFINLSKSVLGSQVKPIIDTAPKQMLDREVCGYLYGSFMNREICGYLYGYIQLLINELSLSDDPAEDAFFTLTEHCIRDVFGDSVGSLSYDIAVGCRKGKEPEDFANGVRLAAADYEDIRNGGKRPTQLGRSIFVYIFLNATKPFGETESVQERTRAAELRYGNIDSPVVAAMDYATNWLSRLSRSTPPNELCAADGPLFKVIRCICELVIEKKANYADGKRYFELVILHINTRPPEGMGLLEEVQNFDEMLERIYRSIHIFQIYHHQIQEMSAQFNAYPKDK